MYKFIIFSFFFVYPYFSTANNSEPLQRSFPYKAGAEGTPTSERLSSRGELLRLDKAPRLLSGEHQRRKFKSSLLISSADEFSGALQWAHKQGITGKGILIAVHENPEVTAELQKKMGKRLVLGKGKYTHNLEIFRIHPTPVINVIDLTAPQVSVFVESFYDKRTELFKNDLLFQKNFKEARIINISAAHVPVDPGLILSEEDSTKALEVGSQDFIKDMEDLLKIGTQKVYVVGAGNDGISMSEAVEQRDEEGNKIKFYYDPVAYLNSKIIKETLIISIALTPSYELADLSNYPGWNKAIQNNSLCTLGESIATIAAAVDQSDTKLLKHELKYIKGTSLSAPIISGSAALLMEAYPTLTSAQIKEVLLESADRTFFKNTGKQEGHWTNRHYTGTLVYDPAEETEPDFTRLPQQKDSGYSIKKEKFDPAKYGKGVLNLRNAFVYAQLKVANPHLKPTELRKQMKALLQDIEEKAATKIQAAFQSYRTRKRIKELKDKDNIRELPLEGARIFRGIRDDKLKAHLREILSKKGKANPAGLSPA